MLFGHFLYQLEYVLTMTSKSLEGIVEAGPQLVLQLYIVTRNGMDIRTDMSLGDWAKLLSMIMSAFTINLASVEAYDKIRDDKMKRSLKDTFKSWVKVALFNLPAIFFKTGTLATLFYTFRQYSLIYFAIWLVVVLIYSMKLEDFWDIDGALLVYSMCLNIITTALPSRDMYLVDQVNVCWTSKKMFRLATWSTFAINSLALGLSYILPKTTLTTLHRQDNKSNWMEENLLTVTVTLFVMGLFSSIMIEIYIKWFPEWIDIPNNDSDQKPKEEDDKEENCEALEMIQTRSS